MEFSLKILKEEYEKFRERYGLPSFKEMNEDFEIEKLQEYETEVLLREIRRCILEKTSAYLRFLDMFLNPGNAPMFFFALIKGMENDGRRYVEGLYFRLGKAEVASLRLDTDYSEQKEAEFIKSFFSEWQEVKKELEKFVSSMESSWEKKAERKEKGYLG